MEIIAKKSRASSTILVGQQTTHHHDASNILANDDTREIQKSLFANDDFLLASGEFYGFPCFTNGAQWDISKLLEKNMILFFEVSSTVQLKKWPSL